MGELTLEQKKALALARARLAAQGTSIAPQAPQEGGFGGSYPGQALSGLNKGLANTLGFPVDAMNGALRLTDAGLSALGANVIPDLPENAFGGSQTIKDAMGGVGAISPLTGDPGKDFVSRTFQGVGETILPGVGLAGKAVAPLSMLAADAGYGALSGAGAGVMNQMYPGNETADTIGSLLGAFGPMALVSAVKRAAPSADRLLADALANDDVSLGQLAARLDEMGPAGMVADVGPNMQMMTAALATVPGRGTKIIADALKARRAGTKTRVRGEFSDILGEAPVPSAVDAQIQQEMDIVGSQYRELFGPNGTSQAVDTQAIANDIDAAIVNLRGDAQRRLREVRGMLDVTGTPGVLDPNPETLFQTRQAIDGLLETETNTKVIGVLTQVRRQIDTELAGAVPGIKQVDARYQELARQREALTRGQQLLDTGRTAVRPQELEAMMNANPGSELMLGPSGVPFRLTQGLKAEIERIIGTTINNMTDLKRVIGGEGTWNPERLRILFGEEQGDQLINLLEREARFAETQNLALSGSRTDMLRSAKEALNGKEPNPGIVQALGNLQVGTAVSRAADKTIGRGFGLYRNTRNAELAKALMSNDPTRIVEATERVNDPATLRVIAALLAGQSANGDPATKPFRVGAFQ